MGRWVAILVVASGVSRSSKDTSWTIESAGPSDQPVRRTPSEAQVSTEAVVEMGQSTSNAAGITAEKDALLLSLIETHYASDEASALKERLGLASRKALLETATGDTPEDLKRARTEASALAQKAKGLKNETTAEAARQYETAIRELETAEQEVLRLEREHGLEAETQIKWILDPNVDLSTKKDLMGQLDGNLSNYGKKSKLNVVAALKEAASAGNTDAVKALRQIAEDAGHTQEVREAAEAALEDIGDA